MSMTFLGRSFIRFTGEGGRGMAMDSSALKGFSVLVVEDDEIVADDLKEWLEEQGASCVGPARTVDEAVSLINHSPRIDRAIVDVNLGGTVAFTVADILLSRRIPFVLVSGYESAYIGQRYPQIVAYRKPFDLKVLER